jgi:dTDP-4-dehydrorhamnose 3,5-epimerase
MMMIRIEESELIAGLQIVHLQQYKDVRGRFMETFRKEWFPQRTWDIVQCNRSDSKQGVLRGLHFHHHQVDYWYVPKGHIRVGLADIRTTSPSYLNTQTIDINEDDEIGIFIPVGVAHGFVALTDVALLYFVDNYFNDGADENGVLWNDPRLKIEWGVDNPILSQRDLQNPSLEELTGQLPQ